MLFTSSNNTEAISVYNKLGFRKFGEILTGIDEEIIGVCP